METKAGDRMHSEELKISAAIENLPKVQSFVERFLESTECGLKESMQISVAVEEIFVNIASYAYPSGGGDAIVRMEQEEGSQTLVITFIDRGIPYDPLAKEDPDRTLPATEREIGGLGIFMTKKMMDDMAYVYKDGQNILSLTKKIG